MNNEIKHTSIRVCMGGSCVRSGARELVVNLREKFGINEGTNLSQDGKVMLEGSRCVGMCCYGPVAFVGERLVEQATVEEIELMIK